MNLIQKTIRLLIFAGVLCLNLTAANAKESTQLAGFPTPFAAFTEVDSALFVTEPDIFLKNAEPSPPIAINGIEKQAIGDWRVDGAHFMLVQVITPMDTYYEIIDKFNSFPRRNTFTTPEDARVLLTKNAELFIHTFAVGCSGEGDVFKYRWTGKKFIKDRTFQVMKGKRWEQRCE